MEIREEKADGIAVLNLSGRLDASNAAEAEGKVLGLIDGGTDRLVVDCSGLEYISSAGLRILLMAAKRLTPPRRKLALAGLRPQVREVFDIAGFSSIFDIHETRAAAVAAVR
jgi:anti-sigma B factor antagonist